MPISLLLGASEADVVSSCRDVRGVGHLISSKQRAQGATEVAVYRGRQRRRVEDCAECRVQQRLRFTECRQRRQVEDCAGRRVQQRLRFTEGRQRRRVEDCAGRRVQQRLRFTECRQRRRVED